MAEIYIMHISGIEKDFTIFFETGISLKKTEKGIEQEESLLDFLEKYVGNATNRYTTIELPKQGHIYSNRLNVYFSKTREYKGIFDKVSIIIEKLNGNFLIVPVLVDHMAGYYKEDTENIIQFFSTP